MSDSVERIRTILLKIDYEMDLVRQSVMEARVELAKLEIRRGPPLRTALGGQAAADDHKLAT